MGAGSTERQGQFWMPLVSSVNPGSASAESSFTLTITGSNLQDVHGIQLTLTGSTSGGMMGGSGMGGGMGRPDTNIQVSNVQVNSDGTRITASIQILAAATAGTRQIRLETNYAEIMGMMTNSLIAITSQ